MPSASSFRRLTVGAGTLAVAVVATAGLTPGTVPAQATAHQRTASPHAAGRHLAALRPAALDSDPRQARPMTSTRRASRAHRSRLGRAHAARSAGSATAPAISSVVPAQGAPGWSVTLAGRRFRHITSVSFGSISAAFTVSSATRIVTVVPPGAASAAITVTGTAGRGRSQVFTVTPAQTLEPGETLPAADALRSADGHFTLAMQDDGDLVYYVTGTRQRLWASRTAGHPGAYLSMLTNGNLVIYSASGSATLWSSRTAGEGPARLVAQDDGDLVAYQGPARTWASGSFDDKLQPGEGLRPGWFLTSGNGYELAMRKTGSLVETGAAGTLWASGTAGHPGAWARMHDSGNLTVGGTPPLWASQTGGHPGARLLVQRSGAVAVRYEGRVLWSSQTAPAPVALGKWPGHAGPAAAAKYFGYPYPRPPACTDGGACRADKWAFYRGQCTSWVAYQLNRRAIPFTNSYGGAGHWGDAVGWAARARKLKIAVNTVPAAGSIAWYGATKAAPDGHVAYVERVNSATSIVISEMNYDGKNGFWVHTITAPTGDWPSAFIHFTS